MKICEGVYLVGSGAVGLSHAFDCHVYLLDGGKELALVDTGAGVESERILANIRAEGFDPAAIAYILLTHAHPDHAGGAAFLAAATGAKVLSSAPEARVVREGTDEELGLAMAKADGGYSPTYTFTHAEVDELPDSARITVGNLTVRALLVPGHSVGSVCYLTEAASRTCLFSGDTVFINGLVGLLNCPGCSLEEYRRSINKLAGLGVDALLPGHHLFTVAGGQAHLDRAVARFKSLQLPPYIGLAG